MGWLIIWALFGIVCAVIANNNGRSGFGWFLIGFLLGPFGLILALVVGKNTEVLEKASLKSGEMRKCPFCAELVKSEAKICRYCQNELPAIEAAIDDNADAPSLKERLTRLKHEYESGNFTKDEYQNKRKAILEGQDV